MSENLQSTKTRVWWDGSEVLLIRWTPQMLVLAWASNDETAFRIPRPAVIRLLSKGVLRMEGDLPDWVSDQLTVPKPQAAPQPAPQPARQPASQAMWQPARQPASLAALQPASPAPAVPEAVAKPQAPNPRNDRFNAIARIIRKLTGGNASSPAEVTS